MDSCFVDNMVDFLSVAFHNILYYSGIYPESIFETRNKYGIVVYRSIHPDVNQYIDSCLKCAAECLKYNRLNRIEFSINNNIQAPIMLFIFDLDKTYKYTEGSDAYLIQAEQNMRGFCLNLSTLDSKMKKLPVDATFAIYVHTDESTAVAMADNPDFAEFPQVEVDKHEETDNIIPLKKFPLRNYNIDAYIEQFEEQMTLN